MSANFLETLISQLRGVGADATTANLTSVRDAAVRTVAVSLLDVTSDLIQKKLPVELAQKANTDLGKVIVGNLVAAGLRSLGGNSPMANLLAQEILSSHVTRVAAPVGDALTGAVTSQVSGATDEGKLDLPVAKAD